MIHFHCNVFIIYGVKTMTIGEYIKKLRQERGLSQEQLGKIVGVQRAAVQKWEAGKTQNLKRETIKILSDYFDVSPASFIEEKSNIVMLDDVKLYNAPLFESVSAGFGVTALDEIIGYVPVMIASDDEAEETICIKVKGDSMSPKIEDGDIIQVRKQTSVDSGDIAVVLLDGSDGLVKKVEYTADSIRLVSLNMNYPPIILNGKDVTRCDVLGKVKRIIRDI